MIAVADATILNITAIITSIRLLAAIGSRMLNHYEVTMNRDFKGIWIPKEIWFDARLTALEKVLFAEIDSLDTEIGCYAGNEYLAAFCQCSDRTISSAIKKLADIGYIKIEGFNGKRRIIRVAKFARQGRKNCEAGSQKLRGSYNKNNIVSNIDKLRSYDISDFEETNKNKKPVYKRKQK